jgi:large subunit ribosomal protein L31
MKPDIHPTWYNDAVVTCTCGNTFKTGSAKKTIEVDICASCHPFFTGEMKFVDTQGRVEKFRAKQATAQKTLSKLKAKREAKKAAEKREQESPKSLKEMLMSEKNKLEKAKNSPQSKKTSPSKQ